MLKFEPNPETPAQVIVNFALLAQDASRTFYRDEHQPIMQEDSESLAAYVNHNFSVMSDAGFLPPNDSDMVALYAAMDLFGSPISKSDSSYVPLRQEELDADA